MLCDCAIAVCNSSFIPLSGVYDASLHFLSYVLLGGLTLMLRVWVMHLCVLAAMYGLWVWC